MDCVVSVPTMPAPGETIMGSGVDFIPGGKGANQAYAIGKLGGQVQMLGSVGPDALGETLKANLAAVNVDTTGIVVNQAEQTGQAFITLDGQGRNSIIVIGGANQSLTTEMIDQFKQAIADSDIIVMQLEIPLEVVMYVKEYALSLGKTIIVDPAPATKDIPTEFWNGIDYIKPNETELALLTNREGTSKADVLAGARELIAKSVKNVIVTLGEAGCLLVTKDQELTFEPYKVEAVDTTAAGDCFIAGLALSLSRSEKIEDAIRFGQQVSALSVMKKGAQTSVPSIAEMQEKWG